MLECLLQGSVTDFWTRGEAHTNKDVTAKKTVPWITRVVDVPGVQKHRPLVAANGKFTTFQLGFSPKRGIVNTDSTW